MVPHRRAEADFVIYTLRSAALPIAALAILNSVLLIGAHYRENRHSALRVYSVRILLMVVIDSVAAVCALWGTGWMPQVDPYVENIMHFVVELYESVVIFSFLQFVLACGAGPERLARKFAKPPRAPGGFGCGGCGCSQASIEVGGEDSATSSTMTETPSASGISTAEDVDEDIGVAYFATSGLSPSGVSTPEDVDEEIGVAYFAAGGFPPPPPIATEEAAASAAATAAGKPRPSPLREGACAVAAASAGAAASSAGAAKGAAGGGVGVGGRRLKHLPGLGRFLPPWRSGRQMLRWCVFGTLTYVIVGAALAVIGLFLLVIPMSIQAKEITWTVSGVFLSAAQATAIFALAELAINVREEIALLRPYGKFLSVKFVVFFAFWQGLLLKALKGFGAFSFFGEGHPETLGMTVIQNFLICVEMLAASFIHFYVFPPHDFLKLLAQHATQDVQDATTSPTTLAGRPTVTEVVDFRDIFRTAWQVHLCRTKDFSEETTPAAAAAAAAAVAAATLVAASGAIVAEAPSLNSNLGVESEAPLPSTRNRREASSFAALAQGGGVPSGA